jgi:hypothetical protein
MRSCAQSNFLRITCALCVTSFLIFGSIGCDGGSGPATGASGELPPQAKEANKSMEDFVKSKEAKK